MTFNWRTKDGLQNLLNVICLAIMTIAGAYFHWDNPTPDAGPAPAIEVFSIDEAAAVTAGESSEPGFVLTAVYPSEERAQETAQALKDGELSPEAFNPTSGISIAAIVAILNLLAKYLPFLKSQD